MSTRVEENVAVKVQKRDRSARETVKRAATSRRKRATARGFHLWGRFSHQLWYFLNEMTDERIPSLSDVVKQVVLQQQSQTSEMEKSKKLLLQFQAHFNELERQRMTILAETKKTEKEIYQKDDEIETTNLNCEYLVTHNQSVYADNVRIKFNLEERKEDFEALLSRNTAYRERMASHIQVFSEIESKLPIMNELLEKKDAINNLKRRKEELLIELENPDGNVIKQVQVRHVWFV
ncbi:hypothetical protein NDU88_002795 [Pleurodeles waltl]|uniref:Uncharacterized protein n=1 Tax=Pleurodeles waltl TaxID=8319 RepID=A0AAV7NP65_PLEWA|nr:hypothetical protein NDU88_002795 [Pleurodeles waltl]